jgi:hypothetical protein
MKTRLCGIKTVESIVTAAILAIVPLAAQAESPTTGSGASQTDQTAEIASLKHQIYLCHHHKRHARACVLPQVIEKQVVIEKPVIIEKIVEKQVFVDRPVEKQVVIEKPVVVEAAMDETVVVEHSKHRKHLMHLGIPFLGVTLF